MASNANKASTNKSLVVVIVILVAVIAVGAGVIVYLLNNANKKVVEMPEVTGRGTVVTKENVQEQIKGLETVPVEDGYFMTSQSIDWHFDKKGVSKDAYVGNDPSNGHTVYFDLTMEDSGDLIYSSPYIPVGSELDGFTLEKPLDAGTYDTILIYHLVGDDEHEISTLSVGLTIYVE